MYEIAKKWRIDEGIKVFGCQNLKNSSLYNSEGNFKKFGSKAKKFLFIYNGRGIKLVFLKMVVEKSEKRRLDEKLKILGCQNRKKLTIKNIREIIKKNKNFCCSKLKKPPYIE